ncbi:MAG: cytochrome c-type biogenesis protein [Hyphomicrobiaceae bacterium]
MAVLIALGASLSGADVAKAVQPDEMLSDPALESRARALSAGLRCLVCQNQSIDDSNAPLARDLRIIVRERLKAGDSDDQVREFLVARFGEFVLLRPPLSTGTVLLWLTPLLLLGAGGILAYRQTARRGPADQKPAEVPLSTNEADRLAEILKKTS